MLISELQKRLETHKEVFGDVPVLFHLALQDFQHTTNECLLSDTPYTKGELIIFLGSEVNHADK